MKYYATAGAVMFFTIIAQSVMWKYFGYHKNLSYMVLTLFPLFMGCITGVLVTLASEDKK